MSTIKIKKLEQYVYQYQTQLNVRDINYAGHLGNDALVSLLHEARINFLDHLAVTELDLGDGKTGIVMIDLGVNYKNQAFLRDNVTVFIHVDQIEGTRFRLFYQVNREQTVIALAETGMVCFDYEKHKVALMPRAFKTILSGLNPGPIIC